MRGRSRNWASIRPELIPATTSPCLVLPMQRLRKAALVAEALKLATNRERPDEGNGTGGFWPHGTRKFSDSFPSGHAIGSWALARVIASEYPNKLTQFGVYAFATAISVSRVTSRKHFPSDALA